MAPWVTRVSFHLTATSAAAWIHAQRGTPSAARLGEGSEGARARHHLGLAQYDGRSSWSSFGSRCPRFAVRPREPANETTQNLTSTPLAKHPKPNSGILDSLWTALTLLLVLVSVSLSSVPFVCRKCKVQACLLRSIRCICGRFSSVVDSLGCGSGPGKTRVSLKKKIHGFSSCPQLKRHADWNLNWSSESYCRPRRPRLFVKAVRPALVHTNGMVSNAVSQPAAQSGHRKLDTRRPRRPTHTGTADRHKQSVEETKGRREKERKISGASLLPSSAQLLPPCVRELFPCNARCSKASAGLSIFLRSGRRSEDAADEFGFGEGGRGGTAPSPPNSNPPKKEKT